MKKLLLIALVFAGCRQEPKFTPNLEPAPANAPIIENTKPEIANSFSNERFRQVTVKKLAYNRYLVSGKAQLFEAALSWVVEDGHNELAKGFEMTDAGAPGWGHFEFTVTVEKATANSTLHLILFEASPKDGSRQHKLPIVLD